jgi:hypothetical protein
VKFLGLVICFWAALSLFTFVVGQWWRWGRWRTWPMLYHRLRKNIADPEHEANWVTRAFDGNGLRFIFICCRFIVSLIWPYMVGRYNVTRVKTFFRATRVRKIRGRPFKMTSS